MDVKSTLTKLKQNWIVSALVFIAIGLVLLLFPGGTLKSISYVLGGLAIAMGVIRTVRFFKQDRTDPFLFQSDLVVGLLTIGFALFLIMQPETVLSLMPHIFGILLVGCGIGNILRSVDAKKAGVGSWGVLLALAIVSIVLGLVILANPFGAIETVVAVIGGCMVYEGVTDIVSALMVGKRIESWKKSMNK